MKQILKYLIFLIIGIILFVLYNGINSFSVGIPPRDTLQRYCIRNGNAFYLGQTVEEFDIVRGGITEQPDIEEEEPPIERTGGAAGPPEGVPPCPAEPVVAAEPQPEPEPEPCDRVHFSETPVIQEYEVSNLRIRERNRENTLLRTPNDEYPVNPDTVATYVSFIPMVNAGGRRPNYRFRADSVREPRNLDGLIRRNRHDRTLLIDKYNRRRLKWQKENLIVL